MNRRWHKIIVFVLLALALIDVAGVCPVDAMNLPNPSAATSVISADGLSGSGSSSGNSEGLGEGCFCFCAHMILGSHPTMDVLFRSSPVDARSLNTIIEAPLASPYHPPRS